MECFYIDLGLRYLLYVAQLCIYRQVAKFDITQIGLIYCILRFLQMIGIMVDIEAQKDEYDRMATNLLQWIEKTVLKLGNRTFPNSLSGMQTLMVEFKTFRTEQKPAK